jgi:hypothetical protein
MLTLRPAIVVECSPHDRDPHGRREQRVRVQLTGAQGAGALRNVLVDVALVGRAEPGDRVVVNLAAPDPAAPSEGAADVVHVNLTRGLSAGTAPGDGAIRLGDSSVPSAIEPVEEEQLDVPIERPVAALALHGQLGAVAWAFARSRPDAALGYIQADGGVPPAGRSNAVKVLRERGLLAGHITVAAAFGGDHEATTTAGALHHGLRALGWDAAVVGPGGGGVGAGTDAGQGSMVALDAAHVALALGCQTVLVARMCADEQRPGHRGISHRTLTVLDLLLEPVTVALPAGMRSPVGTDLRARLGSVLAGSRRGSQDAELDVPRPARIARHDWRRAEVDLPAFAASGLAASTAGRAITEDPLFFGAALAGGAALGQLAASAEREEELESA